MANTKVQSEQIEDGSITADKLADGTIVAAELADNAVETAAINADAVTGAKIADNAIDSEHYTDGSIDTAHIADAQITVAKMAANSVDSDQYVDGSIDTVHLGDLQVTTAKIANGNISTAKIADNAVTSAKIDTNIDIAGTFDVTGATTLDSTLSVAGISTLNVSAVIKSAGTNDTPADLSFWHTDASIVSGDDIAVISAEGSDSGGSPPYQGAKITFDADANWDTGTSNYYPTNINFFTQDNSGTDTIAAGSRLTIKSDGNVGIGTTSPATELEVKAASGYAELRLQGASGSSGTVEFYNASSKTGDLYFDASNNLILRPAGTERMRITNIGGVAINNTSPHHAYSAYGSLEMGHAFALTAAGSSVNGNIMTNAYISSAGNWTYTHSSQASTLQQMGNGLIAWYRAAAGTADNTISWSESMRINADGKVGINCAGSNAKLEVVATSGEVFRADSNNGAYRLVANQTGVNMQGAINILGTTLIDGLSNYTGLTVKGSGGSRPMIQWSNANNGALCAIYGTEGNDMVLTSGSSNTERMRINSDGEVLIKTTSNPQDASLCVHGAVQGGFAQVLQKASTTASTSQLFLGFMINNGATGSGQINANGTGQAAFGTFSDSRLKENITDLPSQLDKINSMRPVEFDYIESRGGGHQEGFIAQEVEEIYSDMVGEDDNGFKTLTALGKWEARLVKAIQEQQEQIEQLKTEIEALKS